MPNIKGTIRSQTIFLRAFRTNPAGPPKELWPAPSILRKWLRKPSFRRAIQSVQDTLRFQADFHLANAATQAAQKLTADSLTSLDLNRLLRLSHIRQRFTMVAPAESKPTEKEDQPDEEEDDEYDENGNWRNPYERALYRIKDEALSLGFLPPLDLQPDFPEPVPQDTHYCKILHDPSAVLWFMKLFTQRFSDDDRYKKILERCPDITPHEGPAGPFPHFPKPSAASPQPPT